MGNIEWQPLPPLWRNPTESTDVGGFMLLVFTEEVPTWEVRRKAKKVDGNGNDLEVGGTATHSKRRQRRCSTTARSLE